VSKSKASETFADPSSGPLLTPRTIIAVVLAVAGIAWMLFYYLAERTDPLSGETGKLLGVPGDWNYLVGFGALLLGLAISAHPSTPLGRGRGVVVGMLGCFLLGLAWICTFYAIAQDTNALPVFNDLEQKNLIVGVAFMAVGFTFATRWE
jgi:drug/metabolite transporter (DMT)-like permease